MNSIRRYLGLALAGSIAVGLIVAIRGATDGAPAADAGTNTVKFDVPPASAGNEAPARARAYELKFVQEVAPEHAAATRVAIRATLEITPRDAAGSDLVRVASVATEGDGLPAAGELETIFARVHEGNGALRAIAFRPGLSDEAKGYLKAIAAALQFSGPAMAAERAWGATEQDVGGRFASSYRRVDGEHVERYQRRFLDNPAQVGPSMSMKVEGMTRFTFDTDGALGALATGERAELSAEKAWRLQARLTVSLVHVGDAPADWRFSAGTLVREGVAVSAGKRQVSAAADRARVGARSLADLRAQAQQIEALTSAKDRARARSQLLLDHAALIRLNPTVAIEIAERMKDAATSVAEVSLLAGSLAAAGTPDASHALVEVLGAAAPPATRSQAAVALNVATAHDRETVDALVKGMTDQDPDLASTAALALGSASRTLRNDGQSGEQAAQTLASAYRDATSADARIAAIRGIGNSGDGSLLSVLEQAMQDADPDVQEAAVYALRFMDGSAEPLLARGLASALSNVRHAAVRAIEFHPPSTLAAALQAALTRESDPDVRAAVERLLARAGDGSSPANR